MSLKRSVSTAIAMAIVSLVATAAFSMSFIETASANEMRKMLKMRQATQPAAAFASAFDFADNRASIKTVEPRFPLDAATDRRFSCDSETHGTAICDQANISSEITCLAQGVYYEARGEGSVGKKAVAKAILNRVASSQYPNSICKVVYQGSNGRGCQFSWTCKGKPPTPREPNAWHASVDVAAQVLIDPSIAPLGTNAVSFHTVHVNPRWRMKRVARIGVHLFYAPY